MAKSICGAECDSCAYKKAEECKGCLNENGCPFGEQCFIAERIKSGGDGAYRLLKEELMEEFNALQIPDMPKICELYPLNGAFVNLAYPMPNGNSIQFLDDRKIYIGTQVEKGPSGGKAEKCYGLVAGKEFLLVSEYGENGVNAEIVVYKKRF